MDTLVQTPFGQILGHRRPRTTRFLGIPFAQKPLGELRFRAPQMVEPWSEVLVADSFAKDPMQANLHFGPEYYSEDCLYLNIWVPDHASPKASVIMWIPGGAFATGGSGALSPSGPSTYDCELIARDSGCIVVSVSYRLNVFGFLNLSEFSSRFDNNIGMKDIIMAMRWVHAAIASFGGDPDNVTLLGESAGGEAISALLLIDEAQPFFHRAIIESNCWGSFYTPEEERQICELYLSYAGLDNDHAEALLNLPYATLNHASRELDTYVAEHYTGRCSFCPVVDGVFLRDFPTLADFTGLNKAVLVGSNRSEGNFQAKYVWPDGAKYAPLLLRRLTNTQQEEIYAHYPDLPQAAAFGEFLTDVMYALPKIRFAERMCRGGNPVYLFRFDYYTTALEQLGLYACHMTELLPLFEISTQPLRNLFRGSEDAVAVIGLRMRRYWGNFARCGDPNGEDLTYWAPYNEDSRDTFVFNKEDALVPDAERIIRDRYRGYDRLLL